MIRRDTDVDAIVVGARVAGAATAMLLARRGRRVVVVDSGSEGRDTVSTHALMKAGVIQLHRWGLLGQIVEAGTPPVPTTTIHFGPDSVELPTTSVAGVDALYAPRRTVLDPILVEAARTAGADVRFGVRVTGVVEDRGEVRGVTGRDHADASMELSARVVIGADGADSRVARAVGARTSMVGPSSCALVYAYFDDLDGEGYEWFFTPGAAAGLIPTNGGSLVWVATSTTRFQVARGAGVDRVFARLIAQAAPTLADRLRAATRSSRWRSSPGRPAFLRTPWGPGWALVGDASHFMDPISAHGLTAAMRDAELLARRVDDILSGRTGRAEAMSAYQDARDALSLPLHDVSERLARFDWDMRHVRALLRRMSDAMRPEVAAVANFDRSLEDAA
jgi:2-polyprenyl-6-methoxyphenol hydroxylase-like FAD-dependent oxidoreductase